MIEADGGDPGKEEGGAGRRAARVVEFGSISLGLVLFVLGVAVGFPLAIIGSAFLTENAGAIVAAIVTVSVFIAVVGAVILAFRKRILSYLFRVSSERLEEFSKPLSDTARHIVDREPSRAAESAEELTRLAFARWSWIATRRWLIASLTGLLAALAALAGTALLFRQNEILAVQLVRLEQQNDLLATQIGLGEAQRSAGVLPGLLDIGEQLAIETEALMKDGRSARVFRLSEISGGLKARIAAATLAVRPYRYLRGATVDTRDVEGINRAALARRPEILNDRSAIKGFETAPDRNKLIDRQVSPERGMLISLLFNHGIYETEELSYADANFAYADVQASILSLMSFRFARLRFANFSRLQLNELAFGGGELDHSRFSHAVIRRCDFSGIPSDVSVPPFVGDPSVPMRRTSMTGADFSDAILLGAAFQSINGLAMNFDRAIVSRVRFDDAAISGSTFRNAILVDTTFDGAALKAVDFDGAIVFDKDFLTKLKETGAPESFRADRFKLDPVSQTELQAHPHFVQLFTVPQDLIEGKDAFRVKRVKDYK